MDRPELREILIRQEGMKLKPYTCTAGKLTIGVGRNLEDQGISMTEALVMLSNDIERVWGEAVRNFHWFYTLNRPRQDALLSLLFNLGLPKLLTFERLLAALGSGDFIQAAVEMRNSKWASQVGERARVLSQMMEDGKYP